MAFPHHRKADSENGEVEKNTPSVRCHTRTDDIFINKNSLRVKIIMAGLLGAVTAMGTAVGTGWVNTPERQRVNIESNRVVVEMKVKVDNLELEAHRLSEKIDGIDDKLYTVNDNILSIARQTGADVPRPKPLPKPTRGLNPQRKPEPLSIRWSF